MRLIVAAVGRLKDGPERELLDRYRTRFEALAKRVALAPVSWQEIGESRAATVALRKQEEGAALLKLAREADAIIVLDEQGKALSSDAFARHLGKMRDDGTKSAAILIGGPDGVAPTCATRRSSCCRSAPSRCRTASPASCSPSSSTGPPPSCRVTRTIGPERPSLRHAKS